MGVSINWGAPKWMVYSRKSQSEMDDDWGYPHDSGNLQKLCFLKWTVWRERGLSKIGSHPDDGGRRRGVEPTVHSKPALGLTDHPWRFKHIKTWILDAIIIYYYLSQIWPIDLAIYLSAYPFFLHICQTPKRGWTSRSTSSQWTTHALQAVWRTSSKLPELDLREFIPSWYGMVNGYPYLIYHGMNEYDIQQCWYPCNSADWSMDVQWYVHPLDSVFSLVSVVMIAVMAGIGSTIMGVALMIGMLVTPYAEAAFGRLAQRSAHWDSSFTHWPYSSRVSWGLRWEALFDNPSCSDSSRTI